MSKLSETIAEYINEFDEGPPIYDMDPEDAISRMEEAIKAGKPLEEGAEADIPDNAIL